ncbi:MAG: transposase, partial [Campylobacterales bacterium]|nr:transposase [Campylobacterales bacterium]
MLENKQNNIQKLAVNFLFEEPIYRYSAYVTNIELPVDQIYNIYNTRADCENRIKELKYDFGADNFCL